MLILTEGAWDWVNLRRDLYPGFQGEQTLTECTCESSTLTKRGANCSEVGFRVPWVMVSKQPVGELKKGWQSRNRAPNLDARHGVCPPGQGAIVMRHDALENRDDLFVLCPWMFEVFEARLADRTPEDSDYMDRIEYAVSVLVHEAVHLMDEHNTCEPGAV